MKRILILGGGFGGIRAALDLNKKLSSKEAKINLIDRGNAQTFQASLYEVASAFGITRDDPYYHKLKSTISIPYENIFRHTNVYVVQAEIANINLHNKTVATFGGSGFEFDYLIIALGSEVSTYDIPGVNEYAYKFKGIEDALTLFRDIEMKYAEHSHERNSKTTDFLIIGAGFNGIELACELSLCSNHIAHKHGRPTLNCSRITLIEATPQILPNVLPTERALIKNRLHKLGIEIMENSSVEELVDKNNIRLKDGRHFSSDFIIWTAGVQAPKIFKNIAGLTLNKTGRIVVNDFLQIQNYPNVFAIGDNIIFEDPRTNKPVRQMAYTAIAQAKIASQNITSLTKEQNELKKYNPKYDIWIVPMGGKNAVAHLRFLTLVGKSAYLIREIIDLRYFKSVLSLTKMLSLVKNRLSVFFKND